MKDALSPKELAYAIGVSESSLRRWVDAGTLKTSRTPGGHRRIPIAEAIRFIRESRAPVLRPHLLGLSELTPASAVSGEAPSDDERLYRSLLAGDGKKAQGQLISLYLTGVPLAHLFDGPVRSAMHRMGDLYAHDPLGIAIEHRATQILIQTTLAISAMLPAVPETAPLAIGGAPGHDIYLLPSLIASVVLQDAGYQTLHLGPQTPPETLGAMALVRGASLVYLSLSAPPPAALAGELEALARQLRPSNAQLVLGGRQVQPLAVQPDLPNVHVMGNMAELGAFARGAVMATPPAVAQA